MYHQYHSHSYIETKHGETKCIRSSHSDVFLGKVVLKICSKFTREHSSRSVICSFIEIALRHGCSLVNLLHIFRTPFLKNNSAWLRLLKIDNQLTGLTFHFHVLLLSNDLSSVKLIQSYVVKL